MSRPAKIDPLTTREREILGCIRRGETDKEIGDRIGIKENTVNNHVRSILKRLKARSRAHAVARWFASVV